MASKNTKLYKAAEALRDVHYDVRGQSAVEAQQMEDRGEKILKLNIGNLAPFGFEAPANVLDAVASHLPDSEGYSDSRGILSARSAVVNYYDQSNIEVDIDSVWVGNGVSELISMVLQSMLNPGDEILVPAPDYPLWTAQVTLSGGTAVHYLCDEANAWNPDIDDIASKITSKTRAIVIINPNNPTGAVYSRGTLQSIVDLARKHDLILLSDEIYEKIIYVGQHIHTASLAGNDILCFTFSGLSKAYRVCGFRTGWVAVTGPIDRAESILEDLTLLANMRMCANVPAQHAIEAALTGKQSIDDLAKPGGRFYEQLQLAHRLVTEIPGVTCEPARAALYLFPRLDPKVYSIKSDEDWALELLCQQKILVGHGTGFNWPDPDHFRLVALPEADVLTEAISRIAKYLETLRG